MKRYLFLDDIRTPSVICDETPWIVVRSFKEFKKYILKNGCPEHISFDHDLGSNDTGLSAAKWLINKDLDNDGFIPNDFNWSVHSANPVGANNIGGLLKSYFNSKKWETYKVRRENMLSAEMKLKEELEAEKVYVTLSHYLNSMSREYPIGVKAVKRLHRTLQQSFFGFIMLCIKGWAEDYENKRYDLRNEFTCKLCYKIITEIEEFQYNPPMI